MGVRHPPHGERMRVRVMVPLFTCPAGYSRLVEAKRPTDMSIIELRQEYHVIVFTTCVVLINSCSQCPCFYANASNNIAIESAQ